MASQTRLDAGGQLLGLARAADVHEVDLRLVVEEVVVQAGHLQAVGEGGVHRGRDLVLEDDRVAHDHRPERAGLKDQSPVNAGREGGVRRVPFRPPPPSRPYSSTASPRSPVPGLWFLARPSRAGRRRRAG